MSRNTNGQNVEGDRSNRTDGSDVTRVLLVGAGGAMGRTVIQIANLVDGLEIVAGVDRCGSDNDSSEVLVEGVRVFGTFDGFATWNKNVDVVLDFSHFSACEEVVNFAESIKANLVVAVTGHTCKQLEMLCQRAKSKADGLAILKAANFSLSMNRFMKTVAEFSRCWDGDIEIVETHHNNKVDAPSGTALVIAERIIKERGFGKIVIGRGYGKRMPGDIGISAVRGGVVVGEHEVRFFSDTCEISMKESEYGKGSFVKGAIEACKFMKGKTSGYYGIDDLLKYICK